MKNENLDESQEDENQVEPHSDNCSENDGSDTEDTICF